jgi:hypothetical protein
VGRLRGWWAFGFTAYTLLRVLRGEYRKMSWLVYYLGHGG